MKSFAIATATIAIRTKTTTDQPSLVLPRDSILAFKKSGHYLRAFLGPHWRFLLKNSEGKSAGE